MGAGVGREVSAIERPRQNTSEHAPRIVCLPTPRTGGDLVAPCHEKAAEENDIAHHNSFSRCTRYRERATSILGVCAPQGTPAAIIDKLNGEINASLADPQIKAQLVKWGLRLATGSPADFGKTIAEETEKWGRVIKFAGIKLE